MRVNEFTKNCEEAKGKPIVSASWPPITVLVYTYNRPMMIRQVLPSLQEHLHYSGELLWRIADDGSPPGYLEDIAAEFPELNLEWTVTKRLGFGANANKGYRACATKYVLPTEDDLLIARGIDLDAGITLMNGVPTIGALRFGAAVIDTVLLGRAFMGPPPMGYYIFDRARSKYWNPCGHPTLIRPSLYKAYGYLPENVAVGLVEMDWTAKAKGPGPEVAILPQYLGGYPFVHLGSGNRLGGTEKDAGWMISKGKKPKGR